MAHAAMKSGSVIAIRVENNRVWPFRFGAKLEKRVLLPLGDLFKEPCGKQVLSYGKYSESAHKIPQKVL